MQKLKIAIGTTSELKTKFVKDVFESLGAEAEFLNFEVKSGVADQPSTQEETKTGSINRASEARNACNNCDLGLGIEVGYHKTEDNLNILCWATIIDKEKQIFSCESSKIPLPKYHRQVLEDGKYMGEHVSDFYNDNEPKHKVILGTTIRYREEIIREAVRNVTLQYLNKESYF